MELILASASPRRAQLLAAAGITFSVLPVDIDETPRRGEAPATYVERLALEKALAVARLNRQALVLGADTAVVVDGRILGKPEDDADARRMLGLLSGREHEVLTGVAIVGAGRAEASVEVSRVAFLQLGPAEIDWYVATGEPRDKAGAYAIQGLASRFVDRVHGSCSNVVGLPVSRVYRLLARFGFFDTPG